MPFDINDPAQLSTLRESIDASLLDLKPFREQYRSYLEQLVGVFYSRRGAPKTVFVNLIELSATIYLQNLLALPPRVNVTTFERRVRPAGVKLEQVVNDSLRDYQIFQALQRATRAAIGGFGAVKVGVEPNGDFEMQGQTIYRNRPYVKHILLEDWVHDMSSKAIGEWSYCGHRYEMELDEAINNIEFDEEARRKLQAAEDKTKNQDGDMKTSTIQGSHAIKSPFKKTCELWEIFLYKEQLLVTLSLDGSVDRPLKVVQWKGPPHGPFHLLYFAEVDGNSMPQAPGQLWMGLHQVVNGIFRKLERQSSRQRTIGLAKSQDSKDGRTINNLNDGEWGVVDNPDAVKEVNTGGIDQRNFAFMLQAKELFSWLAGNLDVLGGLGPGSDTLGQDRILNANSSQRMTMMQHSVMLFTKRVLTDFAYYLWVDPIETYQTEVQIKGYGPLQGQLSPQERTHDFFEHRMEIEPFSMQFQTPGERAQKLSQILVQFLMPGAQMMQAQGITIDWTVCIKMLSEYYQLPELQQILDLQGAPMDADTAPPQEQGGQGQGGRPNMAPQTSRTYNRVSSPGKSNTQNRTAAIVQQLMGGRIQQGEAVGAQQ